MFFFHGKFLVIFAGLLFSGGLIFSSVILIYKIAEADTASTSVIVLPTVPPAPPPLQQGGGGGGGGGGYIYVPTPVAAVSQAAFGGTAYPGSRVTLYKDGQLATTVLAGADAIFRIFLPNLPVGNYNYGVWAEDTECRRSITKTFSVTASETSVVKDIFFPPTVALNKSETARGDTLNVSGQSAPLAQISIFIHPADNETAETVKETAADASGHWLYVLKTSDLAYGNYVVRVKAKKGEASTTFSQTADFKVSQRNVVKEQLSCCSSLKGDLNGDCRVNLFDFSVLAYWWQRPLTEQAKRDLDARLWPDGKIDLRDFSILAYYWAR